MLRLIKSITRRDRLRSDDIRAELHVKSILQFIDEAQLRWYGHVRRMSTSRIDRPEVVGMKAKHHPAQMQAKETMDGQCQGGCPSQGIYTEGDRTISTVPGEKEVNGRTLSLTGHRPTCTAVQGM